MVRWLFPWRRRARVQRPTPGSVPTEAHDAVTAVIVHRNQPGACARTAAAVRCATTRPLRIVVVDTASPASAIALLRAGLGPDAEVVHGQIGATFASATNVGLRRFLSAPQDVWGGWVVVCRDEPEIGRGCIDHMIDVAETRGHRTGIVCAETGRDAVPVVDPCAGGVMVAAHRHGDWAPAEYPNGGLMAVRRGCLEDIGLFDEAFSTCEEVDLGLRARRAGWLVGQVWGAVVAQPRAPFDAPAEYRHVRDTLMLLARWSHPHQVGVRLAAEGREVVRRRRAGEPYEHLARAVTDFVTERITRK